MSQQTIPPCTAGLTSVDLSAWRDNTLPADEAARIAAHSSGCLACQDRLQGFEQVAMALNAQRIPAPDERLWQALFAAISDNHASAHTSTITHQATVPDQSAASAQTPRARISQQSWRRRLLGTVAAIAAITFVVVGFGRLFQSGAGQRQSQTFTVKWQQVTPPAGVGTGETISISPANGSVAWLCKQDIQGLPSALRLWRTSDAGQTWQSLPGPKMSNTFECSVDPDQLDPDVAVLNLRSAPSGNASQAVFSAFETFDGGAHWQRDESVVQPIEFATLNGATYALRQNADDTFSLEVSRDRWHTWRALDDTLHQQKIAASHFWINPVTGGMLVQARPYKRDTTALWTSDANGDNWQQLVTSPLVNIVNMVARPTNDGQHWNICSVVAGTNIDQRRIDYTSRVYCGQENTRWSTRPGMDIPRENGTPTPCPSCGSDSGDDPYGGIMPLGIANDGALLATIEDTFDAQGHATNSSLYRLPAGSTQWQNGGRIPAPLTVSPLTVFAPHPHGGQLWTISQPSGIGATTGPIFTASYPGPDAPPTPTPPQVTATPVGNIETGKPLAWRPIAQPKGFQPRLTQTNIMAIAPSDVRTIYACAQPNADPPATRPQGWVTHDGGASWTPLALPQVNGWCALVVNAVNPRDVLLGIAQNPPGNTPNAYYRSTDGGGAWQHIRSLDGSFIRQFASLNGVTYVLRSTAPLATTPSIVLQASTDNMASWHTIDGDIHQAGSSVGQFWLNPYTGDLLATNIGPYVPGTGIPDGSAALWSSSDGGAHWRNLQAPHTGYNTVLVQPPQLNSAWSICVADSSSSNHGLACGDSNGQAWQTVPALDLGNGGSTTSALYTAYTSKGAILAIFASINGNSAATYSIFRLPPRARRWLQIGQTPEFSLLYGPTTTGDGELWSAPANGILTDAQGRIFAVAAP